jgi:Periplasmic binding protein/Cytochrome c
MKKSTIILAAILSFQVYAYSEAGTATEGKALFRGDKPFAAGGGATNKGLPPAFASCGNCHGMQGNGTREGDAIAPSIHFADLVNPAGKKPGYTGDGAISDAISFGIGRDAKPLAPLMPRYTLSADELQSLQAYLKIVGTTADPTRGVTTDEIRLGTLLPLTGPMRKAGISARDGMNAVFSAANQQGDVHGRRIVLVVSDNAASPDAAAKALAKLNIYAIVGGLWPPESATERILEDARISVLASLTVKRSVSNNPWRSDLLAPQDQAKVLALQAQQDCACKVRMISDSTSASSADRMVLPFPPSILAEGDIWRRLGEASARIALESLSAAGAVLNERSAIEALETLRGFEPLKDAPVQFSKQRHYAWDPALLELNRTPQAAAALPISPQ